MEVFRNTHMAIMAKPYDIARWDPGTRRLSVRRFRQAQVAEGVQEDLMELPAMADHQLNGLERGQFAVQPPYFMGKSMENLWKIQGFRVSMFPRTNPLNELWFYLFFISKETQTIPIPSKACRCFLNSSCFSHPATASMCLIRAANLNGSSWIKGDTGDPVSAQLQHQDTHRTRIVIEQNSGIL